VTEPSAESAGDPPSTPAGDPPSTHAGDPPSTPASEPSSILGSDPSSTPGSDPSSTPAGPTPDVTDDSFEGTVLGATRPVLVDFWAPWCGPCLLVGPIVEQLGADFAGRLDVVRVNVDESIAVSSRYAVFSIPTLVLFKGGREVERVVGFRRKEELAARLRPHL
jgi:thioredoxin 1